MYYFLLLEASYIDTTKVERVSQLIVLNYESFSIESLLLSW